MKRLFAGVAAAFLAAALFFPCKATSAKSAILLDAQTGRVLYEKQPDKQSLIASTTKIMTALVAIREGSLSDVVKVSRTAAYTEGSSMYLKEGETLTVSDLLYGLLLASGNDAATVLAGLDPGGEESFLEKMNQNGHFCTKKDNSKELSFQINKLN